MERVRHARIPVHLNAVLIGEKTVPKGCKVRNVSNQGLLLQCDADGRILTFRDGDHVDIHLLFQRPDGTKYKTIAATVRHVDANGIGVEFCQPDAGLVKLIESYRVEDSQSIEATITRRRETDAPGRPASVVTMPVSNSSANTGQRRPADAAKGGRLYYIGLLSIAIAVIIFTAGYLRTFDLVARVSELETFIHARQAELPRLQSGLSTPAGAGADERGDTLKTQAATVQPEEHAGSAVAPKQHALAIASTADMAEPRTVSDAHLVGRTGTETTPAAGNAQPEDLNGRIAPLHDDQLAGKSGPWVINLLSSPSKSDADRFAEKARKQGIPVEQTSVRLENREFFRVQLTGFLSEKQARESAGSVREQLGLKDVWIFKP